MQVKIFHFDQVVENGRLTHIMTPRYVGYAEVDTFDAEEIWHLCNWCHWTNERPTNLHGGIDSCGHGLLLAHPEKNKYALSLSDGWIVGDEETVYNYALEHKDCSFWER